MAPTRVVEALCAATGGANGLPPRAVVHCASLTWGDLLLWPLEATDASDWFLQLRAAAGGAGTDTATDGPASSVPADSADWEDRSADGTLAAPHRPEGDDEASVQLRPKVPPPPPPKDLGDRASVIVTRPLPPLPPTAATSTSTAATTTTAQGRRRPAPLALEALGPQAAVASVTSRRQSRFGLGAVPSTPMGPSRQQHTGLPPIRTSALTCAGISRSWTRGLGNVGPAGVGQRAAVWPWPGAATAFRTAS